MFLVSLLLLILILVPSIKGLVIPPESLPVYPMMCELYNAKNCSSTGDCEFQVEMCESDTGCYTVWSTSGEVKMKGCFTENLECNQKDCIANSPSPNGLLFCCCNEPLCNEYHEWIPLTEREIVDEILDEIEDDLMFYILVLVVVPSIFIIFLIILVAFVLFSKSKTDSSPDISTVNLLSTWFLTNFH